MDKPIKGLRRHLARHRAARDQDDALGAGRRREPHHRHDREPARLGDLAPARLGRADRGVRARECRRLGGNPAGRRGEQAHRRRLRAGGRRRLVQGRRPRALPRLARQRRLEEGRRHLRRLVRLRLDARLRAGGSETFPEPRRHQAQARRRPGRGDVSRRLRPASRLVPLVASGKLRHARPRAVRRGADPRLRARRAGPQDVEVARQRHRAAGRDQKFRRRHPADVGLRLRLRRRSAHRPGNPQDHDRDLSQAPQHHPLDARQPRAFPRRGPHRAGKDAGAGAADAAPARRARRARPQGLRRLRLQAHLRGAQPFHDHGPLGVLFRRPQGHALLRSDLVENAQGRAHRHRPACSAAP